MAPCATATGGRSEFPKKCQCGNYADGNLALPIWEWVKLSLTALAISIALGAVVAGATWVIAR